MESLFSLCKVDWGRKSEENETRQSLLWKGKKITIAPMERGDLLQAVLKNQKSDTSCFSPSKVAEWYPLVWESSTIFFSAISAKFGVSNQEEKRQICRVLRKIIKHIPHHHLNDSKVKKIIERIIVDKTHEKDVKNLSKEFQKQLKVLALARNFPTSDDLKTSFLLKFKSLFDRLDEYKDHVQLHDQIGLDLANRLVLLDNDPELCPLLSDIDFLCENLKQLQKVTLIKIKELKFNSKCLWDVFNQFENDVQEIQKFIEQIFLEKLLSSSAFSQVGLKVRFMILYLLYSSAKIKDYATCKAILNAISVEEKPSLMWSDLQENFSNYFKKMEEINRILASPSYFPFKNDTIPPFSLILPTEDLSKLKGKTIVSMSEDGNQTVDMEMVLFVHDLIKKVEKMLKD